MAANKHKAKQFIDSVSKHAREERERLNIDRNDVDLIVRVKVEDTVSYNEHEDED